ncbi:ubiquitin carboxyl-terminal hydrolase 47-like [Haliotis cracherodii]|uniref:ubiquitin carboxyl-terminal hydrolase 47-like n=1 Tax=Haliotis cracherodii TaxID=6455 RepID=UPI0039E91EA2
MVTGENDLTQIVPMEGVCVADEEKVLCIISDLVNVTKPGCKHTLNLPASTSVRETLKEMVKICNYDPETVLIHYEISHGGGDDDVILSNVPDKALGAIVVPNIRKHSFTVHEKEGVAPKKMESETSTSGYESQASSSTSYTSGDTYTSYSSTSHTDPSYSYASALIKSDTGYVGLVNQAMTCYLNSLLQTLYMTPEFRDAIYRWEFNGRDEEVVKSIPFQLQNLFLQLQTSKKKSVETTDLTRSFGWDSSEVWQQHDVQELCRVMFDALEHTWKNTDQAHLINHLYQGKLKDYVKCLECGYESARTDAYLDIPLVIRPFGSNQVHGSVEQALDAFVQPEILDCSNQYFCERCNKKCNAHKGLKFVSFPYLLTLQLKRFDFDYATMHRIKLNDRMTFAEVLNLNRFVTPETPSKEQKVDEAAEVTKPSAVTSNGPTDSSDEGIDEGIEVENGLSGASSSSDSSSLSSEAATNDKNARESVCQGPYEYELFSIMIHSGSAAGGHYYAYIKSFKDGQWYSFNDQQVTRITYDDIRKTYGGSSLGRGFYSSAYASSTNAYMLMYRQIDKLRNAECMMPDDFPKHLKRALQKQQEQEEAERKQREIDKSTCKIKLYCFHPSNKKKMESKFEVHKDKTLKQATEMAFKSFEIDNVIALSDCRLVKYDEYSDSLEKSFDGEDDSSMGCLLGGVKSCYNFDLLLETKRPDQKFQEYKPGGVTVKVYVVDTKQGEIHAPVSVRAYHVQTVSEFKNLVTQTLELESTEMTCVLERFHNDLRPLTVPNKTLKAEGFFKSNKVYIQYPHDEDDMYTPFLKTKFYQLLDRHQNTIRINVTIPTPEDVEDYVKSIQQSLLRRQQLTLRADPSSMCNDATSDSPDIDEGISDPVDGIDHKMRAMAIHGCHSDPSVYHSCQDNSDISPQESGSEGRSSSPVGPSTSSQDTSTSAEFSLTTNYTNNDGQSTSPDDLQQFSDKGSGAVEHSFSDPEQVSPPCQVSPNGDSGDKDSDFKREENWDLEIGDTADSVCSSITSSMSGKEAIEEEEAEPPRYFTAMPSDPLPDTNQRSLTVFVDKRITLGAFKKELEPYVGTIMENFKVYRVYSNNQEFESIRLTDTLSFLEDGKLNIKLGRALRPGEHRVKVYLLSVNETEPCKFLVETILAKGMTVLESKKLILPEIKEQCEMEIPLDRCRLRKKTWKNPGTVYIDSQIYEDEIAIFPNWEVYLEILDAPELMTSMSQLALYIRRWHPSTYEIDPFQEIVLNQQTVEELKLRIAEKSLVPGENVDFAKGKGTFPCETSVLEIQQDLDWNPQVSTLNVWPLYICDDGHVIFYRDKTEEIMELSEEKKKEIQQKENIRISRSSQRLTYSPRKEKALKIYTGEDNPPSSSKSSPDLD